MSVARGSIADVPPHSLDPDPAQQRILDHAKGALLVTGAAGTGKTAVLRERFARLIAGGEDPERTALVVRTKRDRAETRRVMLERLKMPLPDLRVLTMHALAFHVMEARHSALGYAEPPRVLSAAEQFAKVRDLLAGEDRSEWPVYGALLGLHGFADQVRQFLLRAQEALLDPEETLERAERAGLAAWRELALFYRRYLDVLAAEGAVDFAGLVGEAALAAKDRGALFAHVLVDDFQDATRSAEALLASLGTPDLVVAGNADAHVFSFQGTTVEPLERFGERFHATTVELTSRHRGAHLAHEAWRAPHVSEELAAVARELRRIHVRDGVPWSELAVVVRRQGTMVAGLVRALDDARIPHTALASGLSPAAAHATLPYVLALRWLIAGEDERDELVESMLTSDLGGLSPATARALLRAARAEGSRPTTALDAQEGLSEEERADLAHLRSALARAEEHRASALDAFATLWRDLPCSRRLVAKADSSHEARVDLEAVVDLARTIEATASSSDPSIEALLGAVEAAEGAPELAGEDEPGRDAVHLLTAHAATGLGFDTVFVVGAVEGDFPSLRRPEPMFDLAALDGARTRSEVNRERLADERRLFTMVLDRADRRVVLTASEPAGDAGAAAATRFAAGRPFEWRPVPTAPFAEPVSVGEAAALWRRGLADTGASASLRLAALDGLLALGVDPRTWWFQHDWSDVGVPALDGLHLSYSRLDNLENCPLQYLLANELGLDVGGGYQAWVGKLIHSIIEDCEGGSVARTPEALVAEIERRWQPSRFPSMAISEAERRNATEVLVPNWFGRYGDLPAAATEARFTFEYEGAVINGVIDRIGSTPEGETRITDYKSGRADNAKKAAENLQLGIYYLAVAECEDLAGFRPVHGVELAYLAGKRSNDELVVLGWPIAEGAEEDYKQRMRERLSGLIGTIRELDETGRYVPSTKANCFFCSFQTLCPRYPEGGAVFPIARPVGEDAP